MCGLSGFFCQSKWLSQSEALLSAMAKTLHHRGPDAHGVWHDADTGIGLSHTRLAILDLSSAGHQPMVSPRGRYVIAFNGEIYNHLELRHGMDGHAWKSRSDTETLLAGFEKWGIASTIKRTVGMFAFALWDKEEHTLTLGRDRIGEKPLYYGWQNHTFLFGSELKALKIHPDFQAEISHDALALFLRHNYVPAPHSIYKAIKKLPPGHLLTVSRKHPTPTLTPYWSYHEAAHKGRTNPFRGDAPAAIDTLETLIKTSISQQAIADVPIGAFLSGGIDSSSVVALMQAQSSRPIETFSIGFHEEGYSEAEHARQVAQHLGTNHTEMILTGADALALVPQLSSYYDEPFADSSQIPTFFVAQLARQSVTVSLSGDAGDELFCGYNRYQMTHQLWGKISKLPLPLRSVLSKCILSVPANAWENIARWIPFILGRYANIGSKLHKGAGVLTSTNIDEVYHRLISHHLHPESLLLEADEPTPFLHDSMSDFSQLDPIHRMMARDMVSYLVDDILVKIDRAAMASSLETRIPFLDHRIVEFASSIPLSLKLRDGKTKWLLRQVLYRHVPEKLIERPKMGFGIPLHHWLTGPLKKWASSLLDVGRLHEERIFKPELVDKLWYNLCHGKENTGYLLWNILMFQSFMEKA